MRFSVTMKTSLIVTSHHNPAKGSLSEWLQANVSRTALATYIAGRNPLLLPSSYK